MNKQQEKLLKKLAEIELKEESFLGGGSKYVNPIRKKKSTSSEKKKLSNKQSNKQL
ncbi:MAG: hypothetical protein ACK4RX_04690 [Chitinophagaceae bacterium]